MKFLEVSENLWLNVDAVKKVKVKYVGGGSYELEIDGTSVENFSGAEAENRAVETAKKFIKKLEATKC